MKQEDRAFIICLLIIFLTAIGFLVFAGIEGTK